MKTKHTCNQCFKQMDQILPPYYFCFNPKCPNFALLQVPEEADKGRPMEEIP